MPAPCRLVLIVVLVLPLVCPSAQVLADSGESTRVESPEQHARTVTGAYPYRERSEYVLGELDLKPGDVVVDIGAGDGFWARQMAGVVGQQGTIHAAEVDQRLVAGMKQRLADLPQVKPYLCPTDGTALPEDSCDLAFLSKTYHHLDSDGRVDYLRHLCEVVKPTGRLCLIEMHGALTPDPVAAHAYSPGLLEQQAAEAGWVLVRCELISGTEHYIAIFVQRELFRPEATRGRGSLPNRGFGPGAGFGPGGGFAPGGGLGPGRGFAPGAPGPGAGGPTRGRGQLPPRF
jgi:SAM-dependent methyltransferase